MQMARKVATGGGGGQGREEGHKSAFGKKDERGRELEKEVRKDATGSRME